MLFQLSSLPLKRSYLMVAPVLLLMAGIVWSVWYFQPRPMHFKTLEHFRDFAVEHGLFVHSGRRDSEVIENNFYVADHPVSWDQIGSLHRFNCGQTEDWKGIVWVKQIFFEQHEPPFGLNPDLIDGHTRIWGELLTAGDPELLDRLEELNRRR